MTAADTEISEETTLSAWLSVARDEAIEMEQMFAIMNRLHARNVAIDAHIRELAAETDIALKQLMIDLNLIQHAKTFSIPL